MARTALIAAISVALLASAGCASREQWQSWRSHGSHFASGQHAAFSIRNPGEKAERVKSTDPSNASTQSWWGRTLPTADEK
jgi:hypothetical protein